jgi:hypothetical protein
MTNALNEKAKRVLRDADLWASQDPTDTYRDELVKAVRDHGGAEAMLALVSEMERSP